MAKNPKLSGNLFTDPRKGVTIKETSLSASIADWLDARKIYNDRLNSGKVQVIKSVPDGRGGWREYRNWLQLSAVQLAKHDELRKAGALVISVDSFDDFLVKFNQTLQTINPFRF